MQLPLLVGIAHLTAKGTVNHSMLASNLKSFILYEIPIVHFAAMRSNIVVPLCNKIILYCMYNNGYASISQVLLSESSNNEDYQMPEDGNCCDVITFVILRIPSTCVLYIFHYNMFG